MWMRIGNVISHWAVSQTRHRIKGVSKINIYLDCMEMWSPYVAQCVCEEAENANSHMNDSGCARIFFYSIKHLW